MNGNGHIHHEESSGNVFANLGLPHAETLLVKTTLILRIREELAAREWDTARAAAVLDVSVRDIAQLGESDPNAFTLEILAEMLVRFGYDVAVRITPRSNEAARFSADISLPTPARFDQFDSVALTTAVPEHDLPVGAQGAVVMVHGDHEAYEVEFMRNAKTIALLTLLPRQLCLIQKFATAHTATVSH